MNVIAEDESDHVILARVVTDKLRLAGDYMIKQGGPVAPSLILFTAEFKFGQVQPHAEESGEGVNSSIIDLAVDTIDVGSDFFYDVCDTLKARQSAGDATAIGPFATGAIDYPGTEEGWPRASERPIFKAVMVLPGTLKQEFEELRAGGFSNLDSNEWYHSPKSLEVQEIEFSESGIKAAVEHVLKLCKVLPRKVFGDGGSICFIRYPFNDRGELVSQP